MKLLDLVARDSIIADLRSNDRNGCIRELVECLAAAGRLKATEVDGIVKSIVTRERSRGTTAFGKGVAAPHAKVAGLPGPMAAVGRSSRGVDFSSLDGAPVFGVILLLSPDAEGEQHLRAMDLVFRILQQERFRKFLKQSDTIDKIFELLEEADERLPAT